MDDGQTRTCGAFSPRSNLQHLQSSAWECFGIQTSLISVHLLSSQSLTLHGTFVHSTLHGRWRTSDNGHIPKMKRETDMWRVKVMKYSDSCEEDIFL
jgi:hypothetical protein